MLIGDLRTAHFDLSLAHTLLDGDALMDRTEKIAHDYLKSRGYQEIVYEPDGNIPPDFLIDGRIAIEVRRLNENERGRSTPKGLEEVSFPLLGKLGSLLASFGPAKTMSWWVFPSFERPVPAWKKLRHNIRNFLEGVEKDLQSDQATLMVGDNFELQVVRRFDNQGDAFTLGIISDEDSGGWVVEELERNLRLCIDEKTKKVARFRGRYPEWWLILVDQVTYALSVLSRQRFRETVSIKHDWDRVVLVNPLDHEIYFEL